MRATRRLTTYLLVAAVSSLLTAGAVALPALAEGDDPAPPDPGRFEERMRAFDDCMRRHGIELTRDGRSEVLVSPEGVWVNGKRTDREAFDRAQRECGPDELLPADPALPRAVPAEPFDLEVPPELREGLKEFGDCLELAPEPDGEV